MNKVHLKGVLQMHILQYVGQIWLNAVKAWMCFSHRLTEHKGRLAL